MFEIAPYATFGILFLMVISIAYLRMSILGYTEKKFPDVFVAFKLYEEKVEDTFTLSLFSYIKSRSFENTYDPIFIAMCNRYIRWAQLFVISFMVVLIDIDFIFDFYRKMSNFEFL